MQTLNGRLRTSDYNTSGLRFEPSYGNNTCHIAPDSHCFSSQGKTAKFPQMIKSSILIKNLPIKSITTSWNLQKQYIQYIMYHSKIRDMILYHDIHKINNVFFPLAVVEHN